jgi:glucokinase
MGAWLESRMTMQPALALAIDLGGTQLRVAVVDAVGQILRRAAEPTDVAGGPEKIVAQMIRLAAEMKREGGPKIAAVGVSSPGPLDSDAGRTIEIPTLPGWTDYPLRQVLGERLALPVVLENDGISAAYGEWKFGAGHGFDNLVYVTVSTGIGGGVVADGRLLRGRRGMAGHVGHMMIAADGPVCPCGGRGCFEALASGTAFNAAAQKAGYSDAKAALEAARDGDQKAFSVVEREADFLGYGFASLLHLYSPNRIIVGGGVSQGLDLMLARILDRVRHLVMPPFRDVEIVKAKLGDNAGLIGAAAMAIERGVTDRDSIFLMRE